MGVRGVSLYSCSLIKAKRCTDNLKKDIGALVGKVVEKNLNRLRVTKEKVMSEAKVGIKKSMEGIFLEKDFQFGEFPRDK